MLNRLLVIFGLFACLQLFGLSSASAGEDFYWKNSYGRGVGKIPPEVCGTKENDAGLCYDKCKAGYHGIGPVCWDNAQESYGRGAGTVPHWFERCVDGKEKDAGLCYTPCKTGFHGVGPVCWNNSAASYGRGVGTIPNFVCPSGQEKDAGLCYPVCKASYKGIGPVCWGVAPSGYVDCGAGFATSKDECAAIIGAQTSSVLMLVGTAVPALQEALAARKAAMAADEVKSAEAMVKELSPFMQKVKSILDPVKSALKSGADTVDDLKQAFKDFLTADEKAKLDKLLLAAKGAKAGASVGTSLASGDTGVIDYLRDIATLGSVVDPTNILGVISAYMYPTYGT